MTKNIELLIFFWVFQGNKRGICYGSSEQKSLSFKEQFLLNYSHELLPKKKKINK